MKVRIEKNIEQVIDGSSYKGHLLIGETKFTYELNFSVPIRKLDDMAPPVSAEEIRSVFNIAIKKNDAKIELTEEEYGLFFLLLVEFAIMFYNNPQTRDSNEGMMGTMIEGKGIFGEIGASASIGMTSSGTGDLPAEVCKILSAPKFGCSLAA